jgi:hypothetical protein
MRYEIPLSPKPLTRIFGFDLARTFALIGMVIISFWSLSGDEDNMPEW